MGNWVISIHGTGAHHNGKSYDADQLAADFVETLKGNSQTVTSATIVYGGEQDVANTRYPKKAE